MKFARSRLSGALLALFCACGGNEPEADLGEASVALTSAPLDAACLRIDVAGTKRSAERLFDLGPGSSTILTLAGLPTGEVVFSADAFALSCGAVTRASPHTWYGVPVTTALVAGQPVSITIAMHR